MLTHITTNVVNSQEMIMHGVYLLQPYFRLLSHGRVLQIYLPERQISSHCLKACSGPSMSCPGPVDTDPYRRFVSPTLPLVYPDPRLSSLAPQTSACTMTRRVGSSVSRRDSLSLPPLTSSVGRRICTDGGEADCDRPDPEVRRRGIAKIFAKTSLAASLSQHMQLSFSRSLHSLRKSSLNQEKKAAPIYLRRSS
jgi:hypothetical protein